MVGEGEGEGGVSISAFRGTATREREPTQRRYAAHRSSHATWTSKSDGRTPNGREATPKIRNELLEVVTGKLLRVGAGARVGSKAGPFGREGGQHIADCGMAPLTLTAACSGVFAAGRGRAVAHGDVHVRTRRKAVGGEAGEEGRVTKSASPSLCPTSSIAAISHFDKELGSASPRAAPSGGEPRIREGLPAHPPHSSAFPSTVP